MGDKLLSALPIFMPARSTISRGFTLIELILALALSVVLLSLIAGALSWGVSRAVGNRETVEQARLVESVIRMVRTDISQSIIYDPQETDAAMSVAESSAAFDVDSLDEISSGGGGGSGGTGDTADSSATAAVSLRRALGVVGTINELQIDVLREHPQFEVDEAGGIIAPTATSGITTVRYALGQGSASLGTTAVLNGEQQAAGLVRQEVGRDLLNWAEQAGTAAQLAGQPVLMAPEVSRLEFRYFNGTDFVEEWDSTLMEGQLPSAIEMRMWFVENFAEQLRDPSRDTTETPPYVVTIALPNAWNAANADMVGVTNDTTSATGGSSSSSSSSTGGAGR